MGLGRTKSHFCNMIFKLKGKLELSGIFKVSDNSVLLFY